MMWIVNGRHTPELDGTGNWANTIEQGSAIYSTHAKYGMRNDFHWHAEWIEIQ